MFNWFSNKNAQQSPSSDKNTLNDIDKVINSIDREIEEKRFLNFVIYLHTLNSKYNQLRKVTNSNKDVLCLSQEYINKINKSSQAWNIYFKRMDDVWQELKKDMNE